MYNGPESSGPTAGTQQPQTTQGNGFSDNYLPAGINNAAFITPFFSLSQHAPQFHQNSYHTQALYSILAPVQEPHLGWHQLAAPQKSAPVPQKLLPEQQSPAAHLALTIGPQVSPPLAILGVAEEYGGGFLVRAQSPKLPWQPAPQ